jgi:hypothetical protein
MNDSDPFCMLARVEKTMVKPDTTLELTMLRAFFESWEALHAITGDKRNPEIRKQYEDAAQALIDAAHPLRALRGEHGK